MIQKEYFGLGSLKNLKRILIRKNIKKIFLITGKASYESSGAKEILDSLLKDYDVTYFSDFETNPKLEDVKKGVFLFKKSKPDFMIAIGGGSVIDMGKLVNVFSVQPGSIIDCIKKKRGIKYKGKPFVAIPTTSGSGSEATHFAVVYIAKDKYSVASKHILPDYCIIDSQLTMSLSPYITAYTGMDALGQAIESYWSVNSTKVSKGYAKKAIRLILENIHKAVHNPSKSSRTAMAKAAYLSGKAINITKTTAPHAISYPMTSYFGIPHGHAAGLTLGSILVYNSQVNRKDVVDKRGDEYVKKAIGKLVRLLEAKDTNFAKEKLTNLMQSIGLKTRLRELGIKIADIELIIKNVNLERIENNPRAIVEQSLKQILKEVY